MILVDSSGWIEYLANRPKAGRFATYIEGREALLISAIEIYEVYAVLSLAHGLAMADSLVYATAQRFGATLVTGDSDFEGLPDTVVVR
ncbi:MAG TPA: type II toxin-antitoxin system VapC family toxin [Methylomirabilota bacterium]|nr:type II toxin-antitoxin system VapC family toxin [Methylomirabilota bacterium]